MAKRTIKAEAVNNTIRVKVSIQIETDGLMSWETEKKVEQQRNNLIDMLRQTFNYSEIKA
jgi:hypothetical protein